MQGFQVINGEHTGTVLVSEDNMSLTVLKSNNLIKGMRFGTDYLALNQFKTVPVSGKNLDVILNEEDIDQTMFEPEKFPMLTIRLG